MKLGSLKSPRRAEALDWIARTRALCNSLDTRYPLTIAYGGYYYSATQAIAIDALRATANAQDGSSLAALIAAASCCAAAPGHTAQPFSTKKGGLPHLLNAWHKDIFTEARQALGRLLQRKSLIRGSAVVRDAFRMTSKLKLGDLVFVDPPYSEVQYSRFYHVLEAVAKGHVSAVSGVGRYPQISERPQSKYCRTQTVVGEIDRLMMGIAISGAQAIVTFPAGNSSNGLSGELVEAMSDQYFHVRTRKVTSVFSTLGGGRSNRGARQDTTELILHLVPKG